MHSATPSPEGQAASASVPVVESQPDPAEAGRLLATALEHDAAGRVPQALDACESCLRLDPRQLDAWFLLAKLAQRIGHRDFLLEVLGVVRGLAPEEPRLAAYADVA